MAQFNIKALVITDAVKVHISPDEIETRTLYRWQLVIERSESNRRKKHFLIDSGGSYDTKERAESECCEALKNLFEATGKMILTAVKA